MENQKKKSILVWLILLYVLFASAIGSLSLFLLLSGAISLENEAKTYFDQLTFIDHSLTFILGILNIAGAILLFKLKSISCYFFSVAFLLNIVLHTWHILNKTWLETMTAMGDDGTSRALVNLGIAFCIVFYSGYLKYRKILT
jgi:hypothetical protein